LLRQTSSDVETVDAAALKLMDDMLETMYAAPGIGLAAVQVGVLKRIVVLDVSDEETGKQPIFMVNPQVVSRTGPETVYEEGCLSIPDVRIEVERPSQCVVRFIDREGHQQELHADGLLAKAIQHEVDHLDGKLIIDQLSRLKREMVVRRVKKLHRVG
ncbi:MAG: peptide deformylase, partial [Pseudomonadota bacterium]